MDHLIIFGAEYLIIVPIVIALLVLAWQLKKPRDWRYLAFFVTGGLISLAIAQIANHLITNPRPFVQGDFKPLVEHAADNGFPSDHTLLAAYLAFAVLIIKPKLGWALVGIAILIALSRMAAGVHHSWDVLASFAFAFVGTILASLAVGLIADRINAKNTKNKDSKPQTSQ